MAGCSVHTAGCTNCYAMKLAMRLGAMGQEKYAGLTRKSGGRAVWTGEVRLDRAALDLPRSWKKPRLVFVNSMSDLFHERVPIDYIRDIWGVMEATPQHTYQILTKRSGRMREVLSDPSFPVLPNVLLGVSVENASVLSRIDDLRGTRAATRFVSFEPWLGDVSAADLTSIDWAIVGGESGVGARPMKKQWARRLQQSCSATGTAFFFKQWGGVNKKAAGRLLGGRTFDEMPVMPPSARITPTRSR